MGFNDTPINIRVQTVRANIRILMAMARERSFDEGEVGVRAEDLRFIRSENVFMGRDRQRVVNAIEALAKASIDMAGIPVFDLSAEFYAAVVAVSVKHHNWMGVSSWLGRRPANEELVEDVPASEGVKPAQLFAILCALEADPTGRDEVLNARIEMAQRRAERDGKE